MVAAENYTGKVGVLPPSFEGSAQVSVNAAVDAVKALGYREAPKKGGRYVTLGQGSEVTVSPDVQPVFEMYAHEQAHIAADQSTIVLEKKIPDSPLKQLDDAVAAHFESKRSPDPALYNVRPLPESDQGNTSRMYLGEEENGTTRTIRLETQYDESRPLAKITKHASIAEKTEVVPQVFGFEMLPTPDGRYVPISVMEFVEGSTLEDFLKEAAESGGFLKDLDAVGLEMYMVMLFKEVVKSVDTLHDEAGVIHNDLKPANIVCVPEEGSNIPKIKLIDLASSMKIGKQRTNRDCTPGCAAPEDMGIYASATIERNTDVKKLGTVLYYIMTGEMPYKKATNGLSMLPQSMKTIEIARRLVRLMDKEAPIKDPSTEAREKLSQLSSYTAKVIEKCMKPNPKDRYQDCKELIAAIDKAWESVGLENYLLRTLVGGDGSTGNRRGYYDHPVTPAPKVAPDAEESAIDAGLITLITEAMGLKKE